MDNKLNAGDQFPPIPLHIGTDQTFTVPDDIDSKYTMILLYRGHWCPLCIRNLAKFKEHRAALEEMGCKIIAGSVDDIEKAAEVGANLGFPVAHGVTRENADTLGAWWEDRRQIVQPSEFLLDDKGVVISSTYSSSPLGRTDPLEVIAALKHREKMQSQG